MAVVSAADHNNDKRFVLADLTGSVSETDCVGRRRPVVDRFLGVLDAELVEQRKQVLRLRCLSDSEARERHADGKPRELHTELAAKALDYRVERNYRTEYTETDNRAVQIIDSPYFDVRVMEITTPFHRNLLKYDSFIITMCISGDCKIRVRSNGDEITLREGHSTLIPAAIADYDVLPLGRSTRLLDAFIDNMDRSLNGRMTRFLHATMQQ